MELESPVNGHFSNIFFLQVQTGDQEDVVVSNSDDEAEDTTSVSEEPAAEAVVTEDVLESNLI